MEVQGWSKATESYGNKSQGPRHPQKWVHQGVDKHNVCLPTPLSRESPNKFTFLNIYHGGGGRLVAYHKLHKPNKVPKKLDVGSSNLWPTYAREWIWHGHPAITRSTGPNLGKFVSMIDNYNITWVTCKTPVNGSWVQLLWITPSVGGCGDEPHIWTTDYHPHRHNGEP